MSSTPLPHFLQSNALILIFNCSGGLNFLLNLKPLDLNLYLCNVLFEFKCIHMSECLGCWVWSDTIFICHDLEYNSLYLRHTYISRLLKSLICFGLPIMQSCLVNSNGFIIICFSLSEIILNNIKVSCCNGRALTETVLHLNLKVRIWWSNLLLKVFVVSVQLWV